MTVSAKTCGKKTTERQSIDNRIMTETNLVPEKNQVCFELSHLLSFVYPFAATTCLASTPILTFPHKEEGIMSSPLSQRGRVREGQRGIDVVFCGHKI